MAAPAGVGQQFATGSVHVFVAPPTGKPGTVGVPVYWGTAEKMPQDQRQPEYEMLMNDASGTKVPLDLAWEGESAQISLVMTRTVQAVTEAILASPRPASAGVANGPASVPGSWSFSDVGALMSLEGLGWTVWLAYFFGAALANKPAYVGGPNSLRPGRRYIQSILWAPQREETGTAPMKQHFMLYAWPYANFSAKTFTLYDYNMTGIGLNLIQ